MLKVNDEISTLKKVLLHRPSIELKILNDQNKDDYLFDEIPQLDLMIKQHDAFSKLLKENNVEVIYLLDLFKDILKQDNIKELFIKDYLNRSLIYDEKIYNELIKLNDDDLINQIITGISGKTEAMPNLYFTRDPFTIIHNDIAIYNMHTELRNKETIFGEYINLYHPFFKANNYYDLNIDSHIEGGDVLLLNKDIIAIGISERTSFLAAKTLSNNLINAGIIKKALFIEIPSKRACMHLDTVFTQIDYDKFVVYKKIYDNAKLYLFNEDNLIELNNNLKDVLSQLLNINDIKLLFCDDSNEQWNDACNTLCIAPNKIIVYDLNQKMNNEFKKLGTTVITMPSSELVKGRGGPHCMSMPLLRE